MKKILSLFLAFLMIFTICPYTANAGETTTYNVSTEQELRDAINSAQDGDIININAEISIEGSENLVITKDVTIDFGNYGSLTCSNDTLDAVLIISDCDVTITGGRSGRCVWLYVNGNTIDKAILVKAESANTSLKIDYIMCGGSIATEVSSSSSANLTVTIDDGEFYSNGASPALDLNGGTLVINGGRYSGFDPGDYLGPDTEVLSDGYNYEVRSTIISPEFSKMLTDGKLIIPSVMPEDDWEAAIFAIAVICEYEKEGVELYVEPIGDIEDGIFDIQYYDTVNDTIEVHRVKAEYTGSVDEAVLEKAKYYAENLPAESIYDTVTFRIKDMEVINLWVNEAGSDLFSFSRKIVNYSGELKEYLNNSNFDFKVAYVGAGDNTDLCVVSVGEGVFSTNGVICAMAANTVAGQAQHVIYVPTETALTRESLLNAAQKRINEYLGDTTKVVLSYGGAFDTLIAPEYEEYRQSVLNALEITSAPDDYFIATVNGHQYKLLIIPDSSKMITPTYKTVDVASNVTISSDASEIPLDTSVYASKLTNDDTYNDIISKLGVDANVTYDLKLFSNSNQTYISSLKNDNFTVSIPITDELKGKDLMAYYVDDSGKVTKYAVTPKGDFAEFQTNHFSIYTIAEAQPDVCPVNGSSHKLTAVPAKAATAAAEGNKAYWTCDCGKWYADAEGATEITDKTSVVIPKLTEETGGEPNTGDSSNVVLMFALLLLSVSVLFGTGRKCV
ncbi:MAG: hypothetical protein ACI4E1_06680 [Lachnospira sp.]